MKTKINISNLWKQVTVHQLISPENLKRFLLITIPLFITFCPYVLEAQHLVASVEVNLDRIPQENQNALVGIDRIIDDYLNNQNWAPDEYDYEFHVDMVIHFESVKQIGSEDRYTAQFTITNRKEAQYQDKRWEFTILPGFSLNYSDQFDSFRSFIDFYINIMLGHEFDKIKKFGGNSYFETAQEISKNARFSSRYYLGWDNREELLNDIITPINDHFRYLNYLYYTGEWLFYEEKERDAAKQYLLYAVKQLEKIPEEKLKRFFDLNYYNYSKALADYEEFSAISKLASLDPSHDEHYQNLLNSR